MTGQEVFSADSVLAGLTDFQRNTVEHVIERFYTAGSSRFLVADETGLGKTIVARGVIARAIEKLQHDDSVDRIDIVYVCSNADLASQNLSKLNVTGDEHQAFASRLTLLAKHSQNLNPAANSRFTKPVNLVSFTPGTSFEKGWRSGKAEERAMLYLLLENELGLTVHTNRAWAALQILQGTVQRTERFEERVSWLRAEMKGGIDGTVRSVFLAAARIAKGSLSLIDRFHYLLEVVLHNGSVPDAVWHEVLALVGDMRSVLARESVQLLEPDLIILDEFQRFRHLLDQTSEGGELAHHLFDHGVRGATAEGQRPIPKTLLLSATPYKPFTYAEEGEDHHCDFMEVVRWLSTWGDVDASADISTGLGEYRDAVVSGRSVDGLRDRLRDNLHRVMTRTERPRSLADSMSEEIIQPVDGVSKDSLLGFVALKDLARAVDAPMSIEYWKSSPFFVNFMDGYKLADQVRAALKDPNLAAEVGPLLRKTRRLDLDKLAALEPLDDDMGNARLRCLKQSTVDEGWWQLLWMPPSMPYLVPGGPYLPFLADEKRMTKRLVFSSWNATPTAIASLLSYEAERRAVGDQWEGKSVEERETDRKTRRSRLAYRMDSGNSERPATMAHLALFWPMPGLAEIADPLSHRRIRNDLLDSDELIGAIRDSLRREGVAVTDTNPASHWFEAFARADSLPSELTTVSSALKTVVAALTGHEETTQAETDPEEVESEPSDVLLSCHVELALQCRETSQDRQVTEEVLTTLAELAAHSPANIAYRALHRVAHDQEIVTALGLWAAAANLASSLRALFARPETTWLLDQLIPDEVYWRSVLRYCAWGNLQAVMDEYVHHLVVAQGKPALDDEMLLTIARAAGEAIALRPSRYEVFNPDAPATRSTLPAHFALRYGSRRKEEESSRLPQVRQAFNSPFRPFVLASTSVGQEGIDFHWWCHAILHWNTPASPIDFEQREGRIDRYDGHAVRLNLAQRHSDAILRSADPNPWDEAYRIAGEATSCGEGSGMAAFVPHWVYVGDAKIQRHLVPYALSNDQLRLSRIKRDVALYRLTLGQPRQEDMLELLKQKYSATAADDLDDMRIDLTAPEASG